MPPQQLDLQKELRENEFRVAIFGSARIKPSDPTYIECYNLAKTIAEADIDLVTGGGPGIMEAASLGHRDGDKDNAAHSIGLNIKLPFEQAPNEGLEMMDTHERFSTRLDEFMLLSNVVVVMPGGVGTALELFYTWQLLQVKHVAHMPVILVGEMWRNLIDWVIDNPVKNGYMSSSDLNYVICVEKAEDAMPIIKAAYAQYKKDPEAVMNWEEYSARNPDSR